MSQKAVVNCFTYKGLDKGMALAVYTNITEYSIEESDEKNVDNLLRQYHPKIFQYCYNILSNAHDRKCGRIH